MIIRSWKKWKIDEKVERNNNYKKANEEPFAFVILNEDVDASTAIDEINKICNRELKLEQVPVKIKVINEFQVKPSGKRNTEQLIQAASEEQ